ncbi:hypothetical protein GQR60_02940 [Labilibaculum sp. A4]|uniref:hypothetical protein n=1 Tax=Labilibaculum euxinus TaxID=2686357 RepID=UPI000F622AAE|nr:hypothetical protein [Labilibaculum euxinus]MDQ1770494.1 hypothetical protein [Labilibaculum euxinus]MWN75287.1 hypothetical protein [Labilibaculum euxinus]
MSKEHNTLTEFFNFLKTKENYLQQDSEEVIQDYYNFRAERIAKEKEEKRIKQLKRLELIVQKREEQQARARIYKPVKAQRMKSPGNTIGKKITNDGTTAKTMADIRKLIDRIRD